MSDSRNELDPKLAESEAELDHPRLRPLQAQPVEVGGRPALALTDPQQYADTTVCLPLEAASLLGLLDGRHGLLDIQAAFARRFGRLLFREELLGLLRSLDEHYLLDTARFAARKAAVERDFRRAAARQARFAGKSYPAEPEALRAFLDDLLGAADVRQDAAAGATGRLAGLIVPHIDYARGGACYAGGYREAAGAPPAARWVILGTAHAPMARPFALTRKAFETPLGRVETDAECLERLLDRVGPGWLEDEFTHRGEHSIEFQAVCLRHTAPPEAPVAIVPILCGSLQGYVEAGRPPDGATDLAAFLEALGEVLAALSGPTLVVASADLAHVGPQFGDPWPVTPGRLHDLETADRKLLATVEAADAEAFFRAVSGDGDRRRICGLPPIFAALRLLPGTAGRLIRYGQWPDPNGTVTFAALGLYAPGEA